MMMETEGNEKVLSSQSVEIPLAGMKLCSFSSEISGDM
jgi:hypothetical protein